MLAVSWGSTLAAILDFDLVVILLLAVTLTLLLMLVLTLILMLVSVARLRSVTDAIPQVYRQTALVVVS
jgi:hypothetical protein